MKRLYCHKCGTLVIECSDGSRIRKGIIIKCGPCSSGKHKNDLPDILKSIFGGSK